MYELSDKKVAEFWTKVNIAGADDCWEWIGTTAKGNLPFSENDWHYGHYGMFYTGAKSVVAHRIAYQLTYGVIPEGMIIMHKCDNPPCCNPAHLQAGTYKENMQDRTIKGRCNAYSWRKRVFGEETKS